MKFKTFFAFSMTDREERPYLKTSGMVEYKGQKSEAQAKQLVWRLLNRAAIAGDCDTVRFILDDGVVVVRKKKLEALALAIDHGHEAIAVMLIEAGVDVTVTDKDTKQTLLHRAALLGQAQTCQALIATKTLKTDAKTRQGSTALHCAAAAGSVATVETLLAAGASPKIKNSHGNTPLKLAILNSHPEVVTALERNGKKEQDKPQVPPPTDPLVQPETGGARITRIE